MFNGKTHYKWPCSIAMLNYQRVYRLDIQFLSHSRHIAVKGASSHIEGGLHGDHGGVKLQLHRILGRKKHGMFHGFSPKKYPEILRNPEKS